MKRLKLELWKHYFWNYDKDKFDGVKFENLVAVLLTLEYPPAGHGETWHRTELSWDGKRDFYQRFTENGRQLLRWAECKAYQKPLSLNILAPTLIMSTLHNTDEVIFFSYSHLNREAIRGLQQFAQVNHKRIRIYDDERLEQLIFRYQEHADFPFSTFFPGVESCAPENAHCFPVLYEASAYIYRQNASYHMEEMKKLKLRVNELFELRIFFINQTLDEQQITVEFDMTQNGIHRFLDAENRSLHVVKKVTLQGGEAVSLPFPFKITGFAQKIGLPEFLFTCAGKTRSYSPGSFVGSWLLETPYFGDMEQLGSFSKATMYHYETVCAVYGPSGAGKTRYLHEMQGQRLMAGKKCLWTDSVHADGNTMVWLKQVLSNLYALPLIRIDAYETFPDVENRIVADILYNPNFRIENTPPEQLASVILQALKDRDILLVVDNVQDFDSDTAYILNQILNLISDAPGAHLLLSFNTDLLYRQETAAALLRRLKQLAQSDRQHYFLRQIEGLREGDDELFIRSCFSDHYSIQDSSSLAWRPILRQIAVSTRRNPLYLEQFLLYLCENSVLKAEADHLYVFDNHSLPEYLTSLPASIQELLDRRWRLLRKNADLLRAKMEQVLRFLCFFGELRQNLILELALDEESIELLIDAGFLRQETGLTFYHPLIEKYFRKKYAALTKRESQMCLKALDDSGMKNEHPGQFYICLLRRRPLSAERIDAAIDALISGKVPTPLIQMYGDALFAALSSEKGIPMGSTKKLLRFYIAYGAQKKRNSSLPEALNVYTAVYEKYLARFPEFRCFGEDYFQFINEYMNALLTEHRSAAVAELGETLIVRLGDYSFASPEGAQKAKASLYNRMHVAYDRLEPAAVGVPDSPRANALLLEALKISYQINNPDGIIQNEIDYGYIFYLFGGPAEQAARHWQSAYTVWKEHAETVPLWGGGVYYHKALSHTVLHQWEEAEQAVQQVFCYHNRTLNNPYFYVKALTLHALLLLIAEESFEEVLYAVNEAEDACSESGFKGIFPVCSYIRALAYDHLTEDREVAADYYEKALTQYIDRCEHPREEERNLTTLLALAVSLRKIREHVRCAAADRLKSRKAAEKILRVLEADGPAWQAIRSEPTPKGLLYLEEKGINYPCP